MGQNSGESVAGLRSKQYNGIYDYHRRAVSEDTPLLAAVTDVPYHHGISSPDETFRDDELGEVDIDPNEFDSMLSRSTSYSAGLGMEPQCQETAMLRGPRKYSGIRSSRSSIIGRERRRSFASANTVEEEAIEDGDEDDEPRSPYLGGIGVGQFWAIFLVNMSILFISCFDMTIMASSHPVITSYFHASNSASWLSTAFLVTSTAFQPLFGRLSDTIGRKRPFIFCVLIFTIATVWCGLAQSMTSFILARALCGLGAGGAMTLGSIMTSDLVPIEIRGAYQSYINIVYGVGSALGAATGGAIADWLGWRWEFGIQVPVLLFSLFGAIFAIPKHLGLKEGAEQESVYNAMKTFDFKGSILLTLSVTSLILGLNLGGNIYPWTHPLVLVSLVTFAVGTPLFIWAESVSLKPIMPLAIIRHAPRANLIFSNFLAAIVVNAILFNVPIFFQAVLLESATDSGLRLLPISFGATTCGVATGFLITWSKRLKWSVISGAVLTLIGTVCLALMQVGMPAWLYVVFLLPAAMGQGFQFPGTFMCILAVSDQAEQAVVTSTLMLWRSLGMVLGVAWSSLIMQNGLVIYLNRFVTGPDKDAIILEVRERIQAIAGLPPHYRAQVIDAYVVSLRLTFIGTAILALIALLIAAPIKVPRLGKRA